MMKKITLWLLILCMSVFLCGCYATYQISEPETGSLTAATEEQIQTEIETESGTETEPETESDSEIITETETESETQTYEPPTDEPLPASVEKDGSYTSPEDVAEYIHTFGTLPGNFITKKAAQNLGWNSSAGNLWDVAPGKSIGGDKFGNREGLLPEGNYHECDVNYQGGYRGGERLVFNDSGAIYYTSDHYRTFTQLY